MIMKFAPSAIALAVPVIGAVASVPNNDVHVTLSNNDAVSSNQQESGATHRQRKKSYFNADTNEDSLSGSNKFDVDVGVLGGPRRQRNGSGIFADRRLQGADGGADATCAEPDTCEPDLCSCTANEGDAFGCAEELNAVCKGLTDATGKTWTLGGCVYNISYYDNVYCPFAECVVDGGTFLSCECEFYSDHCQFYKDHPTFGVSNYNYFIHSFAFVRNDTNVLLSQLDAGYAETINTCEIDACCKSKVDDAGRGMCIQGEVPTSMPSVSAMPSAPTTAPTTGSPTVTPRPTLPPVEGVPPTQPGSGEGSPPPPTGGSSRPTITQTTDNGTAPTPPAGETPSGSAFSMISSSFTTMSLVVATLAWSLW